MRSPITTDKLVELSNLPRFEHPDVFGRDGSNPYYDFLARLVQAFGKPKALELGTCTGGSTSYLAAGGASLVVSVDIEQRESTRQALSKFSNIRLIERDTRDAALVAELEQDGPFDILFIDTHHSPEQASLELLLYEPQLCSNGVILLDDIQLDGAMTGWWRSLDRPKLELPHLHWSGFGVLWPTISD